MIMNEIDIADQSGEEFRILDEFFAPLRVVGDVWLLSFIDTGGETYKASLQPICKHGDHMAKKKKRPPKRY